MVKIFKNPLKKLFLVASLLFLPINAFADSGSTIGAQAYLGTNTWQQSKRYNMAHFLMIPMFYAFEKEDNNLKSAYHKYVKDFYNQKEDQLNFSKNNQRLSDLQFLYFLSTYAVLSENKSPAYSKKMLSSVEEVWSDIPAWQWGRKPFPNMKQRFDWKLNAPSSAGYHRAIIDEEFFLLGTAANLSRIYPSNPTLKEINNYTYNIFKQRSTMENGRWLFDVGVWEKHNDFAYSGYSDTKSITIKKPKKDIVTDTSHFSRMPLLLWSFQGAYPANSKEAKQFKNYRLGLENQFFEKVVVRKDNKILLNNFMDGSNGVFRWEYPTLGKGKGYGPYDLTSTLGMGLWALLPGSRIQNLYQDYYQELNNPKVKTKCDSTMKSIIEGSKMEIKSNFGNCFYLYNTKLASEITEKRS